jgi:L-asparaginase/Glu-tRNA(Gln) amidotransferase subunit D
MSYSSALSFMLKFGKASHFTGSQLPIGDLHTDAKENLITAIQLLPCGKIIFLLSVRFVFILNTSYTEETEQLK